MSNTAWLLGHRGLPYLPQPARSFSLKNPRARGGFSMGLYFMLNEWVLCL